MNAGMTKVLAGTSAEADAGKSPETGAKAEEAKRRRAESLYRQYEQLRIINN